MTARELWVPGLGEDEALISFSQNAEDVRLFRVFRGVENGFYVDIGAAHPSNGSATRLFYDRGWSGINAEPSPLFDELVAARPRDVNLRVAVGEPEGPVAFFVTYPDLGMSTLDLGSHAHVPETVERVEQITVPRQRLETVLREHASGGTIQFLKVDVEGAEREVLASSDWSAFRPIVVVVEAVEAWSTKPSHEDWEAILLDAGYEFAVFDGINRFYVDRAYEDLTTVLAYPISPLDRFVTASEHQVRAEAARRIDQLGAERERLRQALARANEAVARIDQLEAEGERLRQALARANEAVALIDQLRVERDDLRQALARANEAESEKSREHDALITEIDRLRIFEVAVDAIVRSPTWRAGRMVAALGSPVLTLARSGRVRVDRVRRQRPVRQIQPAKAYADATQRGAPWHFARQRGRGASRRTASILDGLIAAFGEPHVAVDAAKASGIAEELARIGWADDDSLLSKRLSWEERRGVVEADAVVRLVAGDWDDGAQWSSREASTLNALIVVDARSLQEAVYRTRGVGLHARAVLKATRAVTTGHSLVLLTSADLPPLDDAVTALADEVVATPYALRQNEVRLFVELSPMTGSVSPAIPFLGSPRCATASVVYDFIPSEFPASYLQTAISALENRVRLEALRRYDVLLPISATTDAAIERLFGNAVQTSMTGVGDPLHEVRPVPVKTKHPFVLVPAGGDPRKNPAAAIAAVALHRRQGGGPLRAIVTGALTALQSAALDDLVRRLGLPEDSVERRGAITSQELASLYKSAELTVVGSFAEGFSIPVAEAVLRGTPVVASQIPAHRELIGAGPWLADPANIEDLAAAISIVRRERERVVVAQREVLLDKSDPEAVAGRVTAALKGIWIERLPPAQIGAPSRTRARVALVAPFPPQRSGVADYTAFTFREVAKHVDVEVFSSAVPEDGELFSIHPLSVEPYLAQRFDAVINVVGNSHFHFPVLDLMAAYGGACIAHDNRMVEAYLYDRGDVWTANLISTDASGVSAGSLSELLLDLDRLPSIGYGIVARQASPLIVHGRALAERIRLETGVEPTVVPFVPYNVPQLAVSEEVRESARRSLHFDEGVLHVGTFGIVDRRTKGVDLIIGAVSWLHGWGIPTHLHIVGAGPPEELGIVANLTAELEIERFVTQHGHVARERLNQFLLGVDVAVQLRTSAVLSLSGAVADCFAFGVPTVTTQDVAQELDAPSYVLQTSPRTSSLLIAEAIGQLRQRRREDLAAIEEERLEYLSRRSVDAYARALLEGLGLALE